MAARISETKRSAVETVVADTLSYRSFNRDPVGERVCTAPDQSTHALPRPTCGRCPVAVKRGVGERGSLSSFVVGILANAIWRILSTPDSNNRLAATSCSEVGLIQQMNNPRYRIKAASMVRPGPKASITQGRFAA